LFVAGTRSRTRVQQHTKGTPTTGRGDSVQGQVAIFIDGLMDPAGVGLDKSPHGVEVAPIFDGLRHVSGAADGVNGTGGRMYRPRLGNTSRPTSGSCAQQTALRAHAELMQCCE